MASEYLKMKAAEAAAQRKPDEPIVLTKKQKAQNWWHYNKIWVFIVVVLVLIVGSMLWNVLGIGQTKPDYCIAYVGDELLSDADAEALQAAFAALGEDQNGDGKTVAALKQYALGRSGDAETSYYYHYAADTTLVADMTKADSYFIITAKPESVQRAYQIFANPDGTPPADDDYSAAGKTFLLRDCPALAELIAAHPGLAELSVGRRCFYDPDQLARHAGSPALWEKLTEGT